LPQTGAMPAHVFDHSDQRAAAALEQGQLARAPC